MSITKDGFHKHIPSDGINIGNDNYVLLAGGGHIRLGNDVNQVPISNTTLNIGLNSDMLDGIHADELLTYFSSNGISSNENTLTLLNTYLTIGGSTYYTDIKTASIINSLSISRLSSDATTNLTIGMTINGVASSDKTVSELYATYTTQLLNARNITIGATTRSFNGTANISWNIADIMNTSDIGSTTKPIYYNGTNFEACTYNVSANINSGIKNTLAYYSAINTISSYTGNVGSGTKLFYLNSGVPTESSSTIGASDKPIYLNNGTLTASSSTIGSGIIPMYLSNGTLAASTSTVGASNKPIFLSSGTLTASTSTIGSGIIPIYISSGVLTASTSTVGNSTTGIYLNSGTITTLNYSLSTNINSGVANRMAWYSAATTLTYASTIYASNTQLTINGTSVPANSGNFQVIGVSTMRHIYPEVNNTYNLGSTSLKWANIYSTNFYGELTGNASTATKWQTARTLTIGNTGKSIDGSANVSWSFDEIGVYNKSTSDDRYVNVTGDTMTGNLSFSNSGTSFRGINYGMMGDNDYWRIGGAATATNAGYMELATGDDGTEPIYVRQYSGAFATLLRTAALLDGSGNTSFPGMLTAASLGISNTNGSTGKGLSLYNGATSGAPEYGIMFAGTSTFGTHGAVTSDWATYLTMSNTTNRGWIFRRGSTNVASIDGTGKLYLGYAASSDNPGVYWNPYVESASDGSDVSAIYQVKSGVAGGTELRIYQANDATDIINMVSPAYIYLNSKRAFTINDSWLRINEDVGFSSGIYTGSSLIRSDNQLQVGSGGANFYANSSGNGYFSNTLGIAGTDTSYKLYVNGISHLTNRTIISNQIIVPSVGISTLISSYGLRSDYTSVGHPTEDFLKAWCKWVYAQSGVPDRTVHSNISPNSRGYIVADVYGSGINSTSGLPEHITGRYYPHGGTEIYFGTSYGNWYYNTVSVDGHTHDNRYYTESESDAKYVYKSGDTMTGNLSFSNSGTGFRGINYGTMGDNDQWRIGGAATASNAGYMELATADDGTEPIYVRQYTGVFSSLTRTLTLLDGSGNSSFPGNVGIGTTSPSYKLHVVGSIYSTQAGQFGNVRVGAYNMNSVEPNANIEFLTGTGYLDWHYGGSTSDYTTRLIENASGYLTLYGKFGVGGQNTSYNFYVAGTSYFSDTVTMNSNLVFTNSGTGFKGINYGTMGDNDQWRIGGAATGSNAGYMEIATADDGNEPIYVRQYTGVFSSLTRTLTLLDGSGNSSFPGNVYSSGYHHNSANSNDYVLLAGGGYKSINDFLYRLKRTNLNISSSDAGQIPPSILEFKNGYPLHTDPEFASGNNGIAVYNNNGNGVVTISRESDSTSGNSSGYVLHIHSASGASPGYGGWYFADGGSRGRIYTCIFRAKIPSGYYVQWASNATGSGSNNGWLTDNIGTGKWEWYAYQVEWGTSSISNTNFFYISNNPCDWYLSFANTYINTFANYDGLRTRYSDNSDLLNGYNYSNLPYLPLSGGTMTGNISFSNSGTGFRGINYGTMGDNDQWRIGGAATGSNAGYMEIATADDGNEPIYVRQYTGVFSSLTRTLTLLDGSGNSSFPGNIHISHATSSDMSWSTSNPMIKFSESGSQQVGIVYTDYDAYRPSKGLKVMDVNNDDPGNVWLEVQGCLYVGQNAYSYSDMKLKYDIRDILNKDVIDLFNTNNGFIRHFKWKDSNKDSYGVIAQEIQEYCPEAIDYSADILHVNYNIIYGKIIGAIFKKAKEQDRIIKEQNRMIKELQRKIEDL